MPPLPTEGRRSGPRSQSSEATTMNRGRRMGEHFNARSRIRPRGRVRVGPLRARHRFGCRWVKR